MTTINSQQQYSGMERKSLIKDTVAGLSAYYLSKKVRNAISIPLTACSKRLHSVSDIDNFRIMTKIITDRISKELKITPGIKIRDFSKTTPQGYVQKFQELEAVHKKSLKGKKLFEKLKQIFNFRKTKRTYTMYKSVSAGNNAVFYKEKNQILININKRGLALFHELGHAINSNASKFWSTIQKIKPFTKKSPTIFLLAALLIPAKQKDEKPKGIIDKTLTFIRDNAGKLTFISMLPIIAEEFSATMRGNKLAKCLPKHYKQAVKGNYIASLTYVVGAVTAAIGVGAVSKIKEYNVNKNN